MRTAESLAFVACGLICFAFWSMAIAALFVL